MRGWPTWCAHRVGGILVAVLALGGCALNRSAPFDRPAVAVAAILTSDREPSDFDAVFGVLVLRKDNPNNLRICEAFFRRFEVVADRQVREGVGFRPIFLPVKWTSDSLPPSSDCPTLLENYDWVRAEGLLVAGRAAAFQRLEILRRAELISPEGPEDHLLRHSRTSWERAVSAPGPLVLVVSESPVERGSFEHRVYWFDTYPVDQLPRAFGLVAALMSGPLEDVATQDQFATRWREVGRNFLLTYGDVFVGFVSRQLLPPAQGATQERPLMRVVLR